MQPFLFLPEISSLILPLGEEKKEKEKKARASASIPVSREKFDRRPPR